MIAIFDAGFAALVVGLAAWTVATRHVLTAVVVFIVYGLLVAIVWVRLFAIDVALTEVAIGSGMTGALLLGAMMRLRADAMIAEQPSRPLCLVAGLLSAFVAVTLAAAVIFLPDPAPSLAPVVAATEAATGMRNPVTNVLMAFRGLDTMLEKVVLLLALVGVWSLTQDRYWGARPELRPHSRARHDMLVFLAQLLPPVGIVIGIYVLWAGADQPGGAFQGGTILAAMWLLIIMAGLADAPATGRRVLRAALIMGPAVFLTVGLGGLWLGAAFLAYPAGFAKPLILVIEFAMTLTIAVTLGLLVAGPPGRAEAS
jgi:multisubunit Na+/H+ antiporter MnhB subunit